LVSLNNVQQDKNVILAVFGMKYLIFHRFSHFQERLQAPQEFHPHPVEFSHQRGLKTKTMEFEAEKLDLEAWTLVFSDSVSFFFPAP
jgi:hypothetical protein